MQRSTTELFGVKKEFSLLTVVLVLQVHILSHLIKLKIGVFYCM